MKLRSILAGAAIAALVIAAIAAGTLLVTRTFMPKGGFAALVGGPFVMTAHDGRRITDKDLAGKPFAIFFGFTQCPDVCPTTMLEVANMMERLGADADRMRFLFVTVDPERDTPDLLRDYLSSFDKRIVGLYGSKEETERIVKAYRVFYERVSTKESYTINHTATMFLMDHRGRLAKTLAFGEDEGSRIAKLREVIALARQSGG